MLYFDSFSHSLTLPIFQVEVLLSVGGRPALIPAQYAPVSLNSGNMLVSELILLIFAKVLLDDALWDLKSVRVYACVCV